MGEVRRFQQLNVWQEGHKIALTIYGITCGFSSEERFGLVSQMRRTAVFPTPLLPNPVFRRFYE